jgi:excisionase family DNA binding protein
MQKLEKLEAYLYKKESKNNPVYSDAEAAEFLKCSTKKLQNLRNAREIGFIRENGGRKILYKHEHLMEYLMKNELKKIK